MTNDRAAALDELHAEVDACRLCSIGSTRTKVVCGVGDPNARLIVVGEGPGENEDRIGAPFVGRAGELLTKMLAAIDLRREDVFITNTIKCRATLNEQGRLKNRAPMQEELANCRPYLERELAIVNARVILALGAPAAKTFLGPAFSITRQRGIWFVGPGGVDLMATFHPAYILRLTGGEINAVKKLVYADLLAVRAKLDEQPDQASSPKPDNGRAAPNDAENNAATQLTFGDI
ncbi:MAG TPA: uracil-DNA glycosylase [Candidatus Eremiobacteraceae bacterium]|nr:uracil-DNA glycosylase [Candidatus Eremiobacteraceae bacterium]